MDNERFLRLLNSGNTLDYKKLTDEIRQYAIYKAGGLPDKDGIAERALAKVEDLLIGGYSLNTWWRVQRIIKSYIADLRRKTKAEGYTIPSYVVYVSDLPGIYPHKDDIDKLPEGNEKQICLLYWRDGKKQKDIATELAIDKGYISRVIKRHRTPPDTLVEYRYPQPPRNIKYDFDD